MLIVDSSKELSNGHAKKAAIYACQQFRNKVANPMGLVAITCKFAGQSVKNGNLRVRIDATFYYKCFKYSKVCPFMDYGGPVAYLNNFFTNANNRNSLLAKLKAKIPSKFGKATELRKRGKIRSANKGPCANTLKRGVCNDMSSCKWNNAIKFCVPDS